MSSTQSPWEVNQCQVLIVSDQILFADVISKILKTAGIDVTAQTDTVELARKIIAERPIDVVVVDQAVYPLPSFDLMAKFVEENQSLQVISLALTHQRMTVQCQKHFENVSATDVINAVVC